MRKSALLNFSAKFINSSEQNSAVEAGKIARGLYIWYVIIVINDDDSIMNDRGTANILDIIEVIFSIEKWCMLKGRTVISANIFIDKNPRSFIDVLFIIDKILLFVLIFFMFFII